WFYAIITLTLTLTLTRENRHAPTLGTARLAEARAPPRERMAPRTGNRRALAPSRVRERDGVQHRADARRDAPPPLLRGQPRRPPRAHDPLFGQQRLEGCRARSHHAVVGPLGAGARAQHLPDRLRRPDVQLARSARRRRDPAHRERRAGPGR